MNFKNYFKAEESGQASLWYLKKWTRRSDLMEFEFSNGVTQFHFQD